MRKLRDFICYALVVVALLALMLAYVVALLFSIFAIGDSRLDLSVQIPAAVALFIGGVAFIFVAPIVIGKIWARQAERRASAPPVAARVFDAYTRMRRHHGILASAFLLTAAAGYIFGVSGGNVRSLAAILATLSLIACLHVRHSLLQYRIATGVFGTNAYEARQVIRFVLSHSDDFDFSGGLGAAESELNEEVPMLNAEGSVRA